MRALTYFFGEATASLLRGWRPAVFSMLTIAAGLFVLGASQPFTVRLLVTSFGEVQASLAHVVRALG